MHYSLLSELTSSCCGLTSLTSLAESLVPECPTFLKQQTTALLMSQCAIAHHKKYKRFTAVKL